MKRVLFILFLAVASVARADDRAGTESVFVLGSGARALAMGRTGVALASDATALFWNPARLGFVQQAELSLFRTKLFEDGVLYHTGFMAYPTLEFGTLAIGYQRLDVSDIERRDDRNQLVGTFDNGESNLLLGYGRGWASGLALGGALRLVQQSVADASDVGFGFDLGVAFERGLGSDQAHRVGCGANLRHALRPTLRLGEDDVAEPRSFKLGAAYSGTRTGSRFGWSAATDLDLPDGAAPRFGIGGEVVYAHMLAFRAGVDAGHPTVGFGIGWRNITFDYALRTDDELSRNDRFTLALRLGKSVDARRESIRAAREQDVSERLATLLQERETRERAHTVALADSAFAAGQWDVALRFYRRILAFEPDEALERRAAQAELEMALQGAAQRLEAREATEAAAAYQEIAARWPDEPRARAGLEQARTLLQAAADRDNMTSTLMRDAMTRLTNDDAAGAEAALGELLRLVPDHAVALELHARVRTMRRAKGEAALERARGLARAGEYANALHILSEARRLLGNSAELSALQRDWTEAYVRSEDGAPPLVPDVAPAPLPGATARRALSSAERRDLDRQYQEGLNAFQGGEFERAIRAWRTVWARDPTFENVSDYLIKAYLYEGIASYSSGRYDVSIEMCRKVLEIDPNNAKAQRYLARIREEKREMEQIGDGKR